MILDLFCKAGGASMGYHRAGFDVVGVDIEPQPRYPFEFHQADALAFPLEGFDATPRAHRASGGARSRRSPAGPRPTRDLVAPIRARLAATGRPYIIENVVGAPLIHPVLVCGSSLGLAVRRHRLFESNVFLMAPQCGCPLRHAKIYPSANQDNRRAGVGSRFVAVYGNTRAGDDKALRSAAMGIEWMSLPELNQAIPPAYTEMLGRQLIPHVEPGRRLVRRSAKPGSSLVAAAVA